MKKQDVIRAWRDGELFAELSDEERAQLPSHPVALPTIDDDVLNTVTGGCGSGIPCQLSSGFCTPCPPNHCSA